MADSALAAEALVDLDAAARYLGVSAVADDGYLELLVAAASRAAEQFCSRRFARAAHVEVRDGSGATFMPTRQWPIASVEALVIDGHAAEARPEPGRRGYFFGEETVYLSGGLAFGRGCANVELHYTAGYAAIPADVRLAVLELAKYADKRKERAGLVSEGLAGQQTNYLTADMPAAVKGMLAPYRRVTPL